MRVASLGSGSRGNATLVEAGGSLLLVDCGFSAREAERRLRGLGVHPGDLAAIVVTHEHGDHLGGVPALARRHGIEVWMSHGTARACAGEALPRLRRFQPGERLGLGGVELRPFAVPHDAREPCQLVIEGAGCRLGLITDAGSLTPHMVASLAGCDLLMLECNYDPDLLEQGPYPPALKRRIAGPYGHLSNHQGAALLAAVDRSRLRCVVVSHVSESNNRPELALAALRQVDGPHELLLARQDAGLGWQHLAGAP